MAVVPGCVNLGARRLREPLLECGGEALQSLSVLVAEFLKNRAKVLEQFAFEMFKLGCSLLGMRYRQLEKLFSDSGLEPTVQA